jgi:hypothetical protein
MPRLPIACAAAAFLFTLPAAAQDTDLQRFLDSARQALDQAQQDLEEGYEEAARAVDQALANPENPSYGSLATRLIRAEVVDEDGRPIAETADFVIAPDGTVVLAILRVGGTLGMGGRLVATGYHTLEPVVKEGDPSFVFRGDLATLPSYRIAGAE